MVVVEVVGSNVRYGGREGGDRRVRGEIMCRACCCTRGFLPNVEKVLTLSSKVPSTWLSSRSLSIVSILVFV